MPSALEAPVAELERLSSAVRRAGQRLLDLRARSVDLQRDRSRLRRGVAENLASLQVDVSPADLDGVGEDELVPSYLRLADSYQRTLADQQMLREEVQRLRVCLWTIVMRWR